jgi:hypothetical protein
MYVAVNGRAIDCRHALSMGDIIAEAQQQIDRFTYCWPSLCADR